MKVEAHGPDGVRELRLFSPCPVCGGQVNSVEYNWDNPVIDFSRQWSVASNPAGVFTFGPCNHTSSASTEFVTYMYPKDPDGKKAYNAQARKLHLEARRKNAEAGYRAGMRVRDNGYPQYWSFPDGF